jgi:hypothetical protein
MGYIQHVCPKPAAVSESYSTFAEKWPGLFKREQDHYLSVRLQGFVSWVLCFVAVK